MLNQEIYCLNTCDVRANDHMGVLSSIELSNGSSNFPKIDKTISHTGRKSIKFNSGNVFVLNHKINSPINNVAANKLNPKCNPNDKPAIEKLNLENGKYIASFWVKAGSNLDDFIGEFDYRIRINNSAISFVSVSKSKVINGWQKFEYVFNTAGSSSTIDFTIKAIGNINVDDYRIQPFNSSMVCYVNDPYQLRLWAQLDDRNYATIMEYDNDGMLVRTKRETEKGIFTLSESRNSIIKK